MFSQGDQEYQFQQTVQQAAFGTTKVGLDSTQSMLSLLNEDEFSQQQQQQQQQQQPVNCQPLSYYSNQISSNNYGSLPTQVQRNYMQYAQQSQGMSPSPYATTNSSYPLQQGYQRTNSYQAPYANQHSGAYYPNTPMTTQSPYQGYGTTQGYPNQGRSPVSSPNMLPTASSIGPKYPQIPPNTASPGMGQGSTMYSPGSTPVSNRNQFQFPTSPVPHLARPSPIQSPSAPKRSPASMTCPSPIQSHSPAPVGTTNSTSPLTVRSPQNNSPSFNQNRSPAQAKQKQEMVDLSSMSKMYHPPSRANSDSDKKHTYSSPKRGGPIPKMEEMVAFIGEPTMRGVLASDIDGETLSSDLKSDDKMSNGKLDSTENGNSKASENGNSASENGNSKEPENVNSKEPENGSSKGLNIVDSGTNKSNSKNDAVDEICENGKTVSSQPETETKQTATENTETETASNEVSQHEVPRIEKKEQEKCSELNEPSKTNNRKRKSLSDFEPQANPKTNDSGKTKRTKAKAGSKASVGENKLNDSKSKNKSKNKTSGKIQSKKTPKRASTKDSMENGFTSGGSDDHGFSDDDDSDLNGKRLTLNRPIKTYSKIQNSKDKDDLDCPKDSKSDFDEIMKTAQTRDNVIETEKKNEKIKSDTKVEEKCEKIEFAKISEMECKDEEVSITKVETKNEENIKEKKDKQIVECEIKLEENKTVIQEVKNPMITPSLKRQLNEVDGPDTCESDHVVASHKKRGRPFGSKNKKKRLTKKERALLESECLDKDFLSADKKIAVKQSVTNTKLATMLQPSGSISKPVGPVLRIVGAPENPVSSHIVNQPNANVDATISKKNKSIVSSKIVHRPSSSAAVGSTYCETGRPWLCALCGKPSNENGLGDLYGPYYPEGFKPPKRCTQDEQVTPQSTKQTSKGKSLKSNSKTSNSKNNSQRRRSSIDKETDCNADQITASKNTPKSRSSSKGKSTKNSKSATKISTSSSKRTSSTDTETSCHLDEIWVHEECAVWAQGVYLVGGMIYGLHETVKAACQTSCNHCKQMGATLGCFSKACSWTSHFICSKKADCLLREENYSMLCPKHKNKMVKMKDDT